MSYAVPQSVRSPSPDGERASGTTGPDRHVTVVIPVMNEEENVPDLVHAIRAALEDGPRWEILFVDDGSTDGTAARAAEEADRDTRVRVLRLARNYGQSTATQAGFDHAHGDVVVTMDGDLQNDPGDIPVLLAKLEEGYDLVVGYRVRRRDRFLTRALPSIVANRMIGWVTGLRVKDNGCSLKAYRVDVLRRLRLYSDMHRFIPALAVSSAGAVIAEVPVRHHPRRTGRSKYGLGRLVPVLLDLMTIAMIRTFQVRPLTLFFPAAVASVLIGGIALLATVFAVANGNAEHLPSMVYPSLAVTWLSLGSWLLMLGLVGEVAIRSYRDVQPPPAPLVRERRVA